VTHLPIEEWAGRWYGRESYRPSTGNTTPIRVIVERRGGNRLRAEFYYWVGDEAIGMPADTEGFPRAPVDMGEGNVVDGKMRIRTERQSPTPDGGTMPTNPALHSTWTLELGDVQHDFYTITSSRSATWAGGTSWTGTAGLYHDRAAAGV
jgi:hypothetical protein